MLLSSRKPAMYDIKKQNLVCYIYEFIIKL